MPVRLVGVADGVVETGQTLVGAALLVPVADLGRDGQRGGVRDAGLVGLAAGTDGLTPSAP